MTLPDLINGVAFEFALGSLVWLDVRAILRDRCVRGRTLVVPTLICVWSFWNLYYYPHLGQWVSFVGGLPVAAGNATWCVLAWRYRHA